MDILYLADGLFDPDGQKLATEFGHGGSGHDITIIPMTQMPRHLILSSGLIATKIHILGQDSILSKRSNRINFYNNYGSFKLRNLWTE